MTTLAMKKTRKNVPTSSVMYAASPRSCTGEPPRSPASVPTRVARPEAGAQSNQIGGATGAPNPRRGWRLPEQRVDQPRHLARHSRPRDHQIDALGLGAAPRLDLDVRVEAQHRQAAAGERGRVNLVDVSDQQVGLALVRLQRLDRLDHLHLVAGRAQRLL